MSRYISPILYILLLLLGCLIFVAIAGVRVGFFEPETGFALLTKSVIASIILSIVAFVSVFRCPCEKGSNNKLVFCSAAFLPLVYGLFWLGFYFSKSSCPEISDITTDIETPPSYIQIPLVRRSTENSTFYDVKSIRVQLEHYPDIKPAFSLLSEDEVFEETLSLVNEKGWEIVATYPEAGVIEATARTPVFGFRDDVVFRIRQEKELSRVDMRSSSRVGTADWGMNANRIEDFMLNLETQLHDRVENPTQ